MSFGSLESGSFVRSSSTASGNDAPITPNIDHNGEDDDGDLEEEHQSFLSGIFGVIYTVSRERTVTWKFVAFKCFLDAWQLLALTINPNYGWTINADAKWWYVVDFIQLQAFVRERGLTFFLVVVYLFEVLLVAVVAVCLWVAWSFRNKRFDHVWPITFLRWFGVIFFQMLDVASMNLILLTMDTEYFGVDDSVRFYHNEFPGVYILSMPYFIHVLVSALCLLVFTVLSAMFSMGEMELNMGTKNMLAQGHTRVEVVSFLLKFVMTTSSVFLQNNDNKWLSVVYLVASGYLVYINVKWVPCYYAWMNYIRCGTYGAVLYSAGLMVLLVLQPGIDPDDPVAVLTWQRQLTIAMVAGLLPAAGLFVLAAYVRTRYYIITVANKFKHNIHGLKSSEIHVFTSPLEAGIAARCCRKWVKPDVLDEHAVALAGRVLEGAMEQLSSQAYMYILLSSYHIDVQGAFQTGLLELKAAKKADPSLLEKFAIYSREQQLTQKAAGGAKGSKGEDLVSYVEQQHDYRLAVKLHKEALQATSAFWRSLMHPEVKLGTLTSAVGDFDRAVKKADSMYRNMLQRHPEDWRLLRMYARFVEFIRNDPWAAAKWNAEADRLWEEEENDKHNCVNLKALADKDERMAELVRSAMEDATKGCLIVDAQCTINYINKTACGLVGWEVHELRGKNMSLFLPGPYAEQHDGWVRNFTGSDRSSKSLERTARWVVMVRRRRARVDEEFESRHQGRHTGERYLIDVKVWLAKISGSGMDCMFLATLEPLPPAPNTAVAWASGSGALLSADAAFCDHFGYRTDEIAGINVSSLVVEEDVLNEVLHSGRSRDPAKYYAGTGSAAKPGAGSASLPSSVHSGTAMLALMPGPLEPAAAAATLSVGGGTSSLRGAPTPGGFVTLGGGSVEDTRVKVLHVKHKFAGPVACSATVAYGGVGTHHLFILSIQRSKHAQLPMLVTDSKGKVIHASKDMTSVLGYSVPELLGELSTRLWDAIIPQPFCQLHRLHINDLTQIKGAQSPHSCRSGVSVCVSTMTSQGVQTRPVKLKVQSRRADDGGDVCNVVTFDKLTMEQALDERCLSLLVDEMGVVCEAGNSPATLFGFDPQAAVGRHVGDMVDVFTPKTGDGVDGTAYAQSTLVELIKMCVESPESSFRVGVSAPLDHSPALIVGGAADGTTAGLGSGGSATGKLSSIMDAVSAIMHTQGLRSAVMQVKLHLPGSRPDASDLAVRARDARRPNKAQQEAKMQRDSACLPSDEEEEEHAYVREGSSTLPGLLVELLLWRADLLSGILELDSEGAIVATTDLPLHAPGLLLGLPSDALVGMHIRDVLPEMAGKQAADLFLPSFGIGTARTGGKRGGLKKKVEKDDKPGPVNVARLRHLVDGLDMELNVQALRKQADASTAGPLRGPGGGSGGTTLVLLHAHKPSAGMLRFCDWLRAHPHAVLGQAPRTPLTKLLSHGAGSSNWGGKAAAVDTQGTAPLAAGLADSSSLSPAPPQQQRFLLPGGGVAGDEDGSAAAAAPGAGQGAAKGKRRMLGATGSPQPAGGISGELELATTADGSVAEAAKPRSPSAAALAIDGEPPLAPSSGSGSGSGSGSEDLPRVAAWVVTNGAPGKASSPPSLQASMMARSGSPVTAARAGRQGSVSRVEVEDVEDGELEEEEDEDGSKHGGLARGAGKDTPAQQLPMPLKSGLLGPTAADKSACVAGSEDGSAQDGEHQSEASGGDPASGDGGDYRRGQRFKRVSRLLLGEATRKNIRAFKWKAWGAAAFVACVSIACFVTMLVLLTQQQLGVVNLNNIGLAARSVTNIYLTMVDINVLFQGRGLPTLPNLSNASDLPYQLDILTSAANDFQSLMDAAYFKILSADDSNGLHALWNTPNLNLTLYYTTATGGVSTNYSLLSLFDAANLFSRTALDIAHNAYVRNATSYGTSAQWRDWTNCKLVTSNVVAILNGVLTTLDDLVEAVIEDTNSMNQVQYILIGLEGATCSLLAFVFVFAGVTKINVQRYNLYNVFMTIPKGLLQSLASKTVSLGDAAVEQQPNEAEPEPTGGGGGRGGLPAPDLGAPGGALLFATSVKVQNDSIFASMRSSAAEAFRRCWPCGGRVMPADGSRGGGRDGSAHGGRGGRGGLGGGSKRRLTRNHRTALFLASPFLVWGIVMIAINAAGHSQLSGVSGPIALFNIVNFCIARFYRNFSLTQDMISTTDPVAKEVARANTLVLFVVPLEYTAMVYGGSAVPSQTSPHFTRVTSGVAFTGSAGSDILFRTHACLREDQSTCLPPTSPLYPYVSDGLDALMNTYFFTIREILGMSGPQPMPNSTEFYLMWNVKPDIEGGLFQINSIYYNYVNSVYSGCLQIHITGLVLTMLIMAVFTLFMLRPFLSQITNETKRIAELLNQLPTDVDVEGMVRRAQGTVTAAASDSSNAGARRTASESSKFPTASFVL